MPRILLVRGAENGSEMTSIESYFRRQVWDVGTCVTNSPQLCLKEVDHLDPDAILFIGQKELCAAVTSTLRELGLQVCMVYVDPAGGEPTTVELSAPAILVGSPPSLPSLARVIKGMLMPTR